MQELSLCFISAACFSAFYCSPTLLILKISNFSLDMFMYFFQSSNFIATPCTFTVENKYSSNSYCFFVQAAKDNSMAMTWWLCYIEIMCYEDSCLLKCFIVSYCLKFCRKSCWVTLIFNSHTEQVMPSHYTPLLKAPRPPLSTPFYNTQVNTIKQSL